MANRNLDLPPQQASSGGPPGVDAAALAKLAALKLPPGPRQSALARLALVLAKLPQGNSRSFLP